VLANFRWTFMLKDDGTAFPSWEEDLRSGTKASSSSQSVLSSGDVLESAASTVLRKAARNRSRKSNALFKSGEISYDEESKSVVSSRRSRILLCSRFSRRLLLKT
jgi:hypothetical protein